MGEMLTSIVAHYPMILSLLRSIHIILILAINLNWLYHKPANKLIALLLYVNVHIWVLSNMRSLLMGGQGSFSLVHA